MGSVSTGNGSLIMIWITVVAKGPWEDLQSHHARCYKNIWVTAPEWAKLRGGSEGH